MDSDRRPASAPPALPVVIIAAHPIVRSGLGRLLAERVDLSIIGEAASVAEATTLLADAQPRAILFVPEGGAEEIGAVTNLALEAEVPVVLLDGEQTGEFDVNGRLPADASPEQIAAALHAVAAGLSVSRFSSNRTASQSREPRGSDDPLTDREMQVLQLVAGGLPNKGIARRLSISEHTVKFHVGSILSKLNAASRTEAVTQAAHRGLLTL